MDIYPVFVKSEQPRIVFPGDFLLAWMKDIISSPKIAEFLSLLVNVIKFNAAYLDEDIVAALVL